MSSYTLGTISISRQAKQYINQILETKRLSYGPFCQKFENEFASLHDCSQGIVCSSGTAALHTILTALKLQHNWNDQTEVIAPSVTFVATINAIIQAGLKPVLVDVNLNDFNLDHKLIEEKVTKNSKAVLAVHLFGRTAQLDKITKICKQKNLLLVEDCCEIIGAKIKNKMVGSWGEAGAFSTNSAHILATGIGGIITTNNTELAILMRSLVNHGRDNSYISIDDDKDRSSASFSNIIQKRFLFNQVGFSYRLSELEGAIGLSQLNNIKTILKKRSANVIYLNKQLAKLEKFLTAPDDLCAQEMALMAYPLVLTSYAIKTIPHCLNNLILFLEKNDIETRPLMPIISQPAYQHLKFKEKDFPIAKQLLSSGFYVGCHQDLAKKDLDYLVTKLLEFFSK